MTNLDNILKSRDITLPTKVRLVKAMVFPVVMYGCESWTIKKAERRKIDAFELWCWRRLESPLDCKEIQPVHPRGDQSWVSTGRTDVEAESPILWPPDVKSWLFWKDPDSGKDWRQEEKVTTEDEIVGWHPRLNGHGFGWTPGVGDGQGGLACCSPWGCKELDTTERLNWSHPVYDILLLQRKLSNTSMHEHGLESFTRLLRLWWVWQWGQGQNKDVKPLELCWSSYYNSILLKLFWSFKKKLLL